VVWTVRKERREEEERKKLAEASPSATPPDAGA
jgi:hypothetical protein